jgi:hypothetical protein
MNTSSVSILKPVIVGIEVQKGDPPLKVELLGKRGQAEAPTLIGQDGVEPISTRRDGRTILRVSAISGSPLTYQWQRDGVDIPDAIEPGFSFSTSELTSTSTFRCIVSNAFGVDTANGAVISKGINPGESNGLSGESELLSSFGNGVPREYFLEQNYPNPFNPTTRIRYAIPRDQHVKLEVFNVLGERVAIIEDQDHTMGYYEAVFDGGNLASGIYVYRIQAGDFVASKRLLVLR